MENYLFYAQIFLAYKNQTQILNSKLNFWGCIMDTRHYDVDKNTAVRREIIEKYIGWGEDIFSAEVDRGHKNGNEINKAYELF